jgi:hypothetical protein
VLITEVAVEAALLFYAEAHGLTVDRGTDDLRNFD